MPSSVEIAKALLVITATGAIIVIGWKERWFIHKVGIVGLFATFWIMAVTAFPMPAPRTWQIAVTLIVFALCAIFAFWEPSSGLEQQVDRMVQAKTTRKETNNEEVEYVPVPDNNGPGDTTTSWVPQ